MLAQRKPHSTEDNGKLSRVVTASLGGAALIACSVATSTAGATALVNEPTIAASIEVRDTTVRDSGLSTVIRNAGDKRIDAVELLVRYDWLWKDEHNPGDDNPGWAEFVTLKSDLAPGDTTTFVYDLQRPVPQRNDGWFMPSVKAVGFTPYK